MSGETSHKKDRGRNGEGRCVMMDAYLGERERGGSGGFLKNKKTVLPQK